MFDAKTLIGIGVLESARVGRAGDQMQLAYLYVSRDYRGRGVGRQLFDAAVSLAREAGASALYVSATPTAVQSWRFRGGAGNHNRVLPLCQHTFAFGDVLNGDGSRPGVA